MKQNNEAGPRGLAREIKFRAWDIKHKRMFEPDYIGWVGDKRLGYRPVVYSHIDYESPYEVDNCEVMQYTGLRDKNGVEIFEGDILKDVGVVVFGVWYAYLENGLSGSYNITGFYIPGEDCEPCRPIEDDRFNEVIGNIYENGNLLGD